jgi:type IV pilus assembly protein PilC
MASKDEHKHQGASAPPHVKRGLFQRTSRELQSNFLESMALLVAAGIDSATALDSVASATKNKGFRRRLHNASEYVKGGYPLWLSLQEHGILPLQRTWLIRIGEESGQLAKHFKAAVTQHRKEQMFRARVQAAMLYPVIIAVVAMVAAVGVAWFILPRLSTVFSTLQVELPLLTRWLLAAGQFLGKYGYVAVPSAVGVLIFLFLALFVLPGSRRIGEWILMHMPGIKGLLRDGELAKFGHVFGSLLQVGVPIPEALDALKSSSTLETFQKLYERLKIRIVNGEGFEKAFKNDAYLARTMPQTIQQLLVTAEQSGQMAETVTSMGDIYEGRLDLGTKNLTVILEPILLFAVWLGVVLLAVAIITPIYSVLQGVSR